MDSTAPRPIFRSQRLGRAWPNSLTEVARALAPVVYLLFFPIGSVEAQVPQLRSGNATPITSGVNSGIGSPVDIPQTNLTPIGPSTNFAVPPSGGASAFADPYAITPNPGGIAGAPGGAGVFGAPTAMPPTQGASLFSRIFSRPASTPIGQGFAAPSNSPGFAPSVTSPGFAPAPGGGNFGQPSFAPGGYGTESVYGAPSYGVSPGFNSAQAYGQPSYPNSIYPSSSPSTLFPGGLFSGGAYAPSGSGVGATAFRLFQGPRIRHTYLPSGNGPTDVEINDTDVSLVFAVPRFFYSNQPLFIIPSFSLHLWDGPNGATGADLPGSAYSAFLDAGWETDPTAMFGTEFGVRVGAFTDFDTFNSRSIRILGKALVHFRLTPYSTLRAGVYYLDRNKVKLVPAGGILYQPNPYTRFDIFIPQPKLARYWRTIGTRDVWWYLAGDYGGGSWTIERTDRSEDSVDLNDIRVILGVEWGLSDAIRAGRRTGFAEIGYVFDREVEYRSNPLDDIKPDDAFMFRVGIGY